MFNGIIYNQGIVSKILKKNNFYIIEIKSKFKISKKEIGSSICCNGVCLTLTKIKGYLLITALVAFVLICSLYNESFSQNYLSHVYNPSNLERNPLLCYISNSEYVNIIYTYLV